MTPRPGIALALVGLLTGASLALASPVPVDNPASERANGIHAQAKAFAASDHVPVRKFVDDPWPEGFDTRPGDNLSRASAGAALGISWRGFSLDYIRRADALLIASGDTARAHYLAQTDQLFSAARSLNLDYRLKGFEADGLRFGMQTEHTNALIGGRTRWGASFNLLRGLRLRSEEARGQFTTDTNTASLNGTREIWYSDLRPSSETSFSAFHPFEERAVASSGSGRSLDLGLVHHFENGLRVDASLNDLGGTLHWSGIPHMSQVFAINNLSRTSYESSGTPAVSGFNNYVDYRMKLDVKRELGVTVPISLQWAMNAQISSVAGQIYPLIGARWETRAYESIAFDYETRHRSFGFGISRPNWVANLRTDRLAVGNAKALGFGFALRIPI